MSLYDTYSLYDFLYHTPESGLRKILIDRKSMTDVHCNMLFKIVKGCSQQQFDEHFQAKTFPRVRLSPAEDKLKEKFWDDCTKVLLERGVLQPMPTSSPKVAA